MSALKNEPRCAFCPVDEAIEECNISCNLIPGPWNVQDPESAPLDELGPVQGGGAHLAPPPASAADILDRMAQTFRTRNDGYIDNYKMVAPIMRILFPQGVPSALVTSDKWHLFELLVIKLTRYCTSGMQHVDSIHDAGVYAAMIEFCMQQEVQPKDSQ